METKEVNIIWEDKPAKVVIGEITWKDKKDAIRQAMRSSSGVAGRKELDPVLQKELMMLKSIKKAPFEPIIDNFNRLRSKDGEKIFKAFVELNEYEGDEEGE